MSPRHKAVASLVAAMVLVGSSVAVGRILVASLPIHFASLVRFLLASLVLAPLVALGPGGFPRLSRRTLAILGGQAVCGSFLFTVCLLGGLRLTGAAEAGVVAATTPAAVALLGWAFFRERPRPRALAGILAAMAGLTCLHAGEATAGAGPAPLAGNALVLCAVGFEAVFLLLRRAVTEPLSPLAAAMWVSLWGAALFLVPGLWQAASLHRADVTPAAVAAVVYYGLGVTAAAYILWFYGVVRVDAATAGVATAVMPVAALAFAALLCGDRIGWRELAGCAGVLAGILCLAGGRKAAAAGGEAKT
ncbi:DMT family transporter [Solidesulfovibrio sp.]|uniref:DMT family transporter n=1 Tax=Solidesulfovibrio sp. TaxID=2910990 RepID=UPI002B1F89EE|nr:DMT family transporter [Solidesulfovibrio sp.]MEA4854805.1 DMT family transporter [Solidesulfovibrio sp.]